jgi:hypothetical protein
MAVPSGAAFFTCNFTLRNPIPALAFTYSTCLPFLFATCFLQLRTSIMPYNATTALSFCQRQTGRYRDGECWTLMEDAVVGAGGTSSRTLTPRFSPAASFVWGSVVAIGSLQPGDVLQFSGYSWTKTVVTDVTNPDGSGPTDTVTSTENRGQPQHSAMVVRVISSGIIDVIEQNIPATTGPVQTVRLVLIAPAATTTTTRVPDGQGGQTVTVVTETHTVTAPPRCYRPR